MMNMGIPPNQAKKIDGQNKNLGMYQNPESNQYDMNQMRNNNMKNKKVEKKKFIGRNNP